MFRRLLPALALPTLVGCEQPTRTIVVSQPAGCDTRFNEINNSSGTVEQRYFSHSSQGSWGSDQLGRNGLPPGTRAANTGHYDFRVVWANGQSAELRQVNVCVAGNIYVTDRGLSASWRGQGRRQAFAARGNPAGYLALPRC
ncbi:hypothetical protein JYK14_27595 [Siccirubricoccus sp. KC 17139]|uniref:Lipoprotein n=1 Tax=Siccirubricoccus soli TaxID=2899147 RepID=A0ABT1DD86_9PROT|nr:hypothetical protein [Siccirubricoccus soli]MCO6419896.1 hypothetical protein [Siccirubricoccus soli]MCP2686031.1 hypothetical protein [Siccirubricoccus soli]